MYNYKELKKRAPAVPMSVSQIIDVFQSLGNKIPSDRVIRVRLIGTVVSKSFFEGSTNKKPFCYLDVEDLTGVIRVKAWDELAQTISDKINIGDTVLVIGKVKQSNESIFISAEIMRQLDDPIWELHNYLSSLHLHREYSSSGTASATDDSSLLGDLIEKILFIIQENSRVSAVPLEVIEQKLPHVKKEIILKAINSLIENGEIYEVSERKYKVVEG